MTRQAVKWQVINIVIVTLPAIVVPQVVTVLMCPIRKLQSRGNAKEGGTYVASITMPASQREW